MNIVIADDHDLILEGFASIVKDKLPTCTVDTVNNKQELFQLLNTKSVNILFQDIRFGEYDAREFLKEIKQLHPELKIIIISTFTDEFTITSMFNQGIDGYITKSADSEEIISAIQASVKGEKYLSMDIRGNVNNNNIKSAKSIALTSREKEVLMSIINGKTIKETSKELFLSEKTIETYRANLFIKFDVPNSVSLVKKAILQGFI